MIGIWAAAIVQSAAMSPATTGDLALDTFRAACTPYRQDYAAMNAALEAEGWRRVGEDDHPELAAVQAAARAEMDDPDMPEMTLDQTLWGRTVQGRRFYVVTSRMDALIGETRDRDGDGVIAEHEQATEFDQISCGLWDFDAVEPVAPGAMTVWTASLPVQSIDLPGQMIGGTWNVYHFMPGTADVKIGFIPDESPWVTRTGFTGLSIVMSSAPLDDETGTKGENP